VFYTYAHYTPQGRLFYIGKGLGERAYKKDSRNQHWQNVVFKYGNPDVQILAHWDTEQEALDHEALLISCFRDLGHKLCNLSDGGKGNAGIKMSDETKEKISLAKKGTPAWNKGIPLTEDCKQKLSVAMSEKISWNKGKKHTEEHKRKTGLAKVDNLNCLRYKIVGANIETGKKAMFIGAKALNAAGFTHTAVYMCINGQRKSHKGYTWAREVLENK
jgi:hypothetical protein